MWKSFNLLLLIQAATLEVRSQSFLPPDQQFQPVDAFPSCVEVTDVWPPPHSALKPFAETHNSLVHYAMRITFSKPVGIESMDTTGGYQPEIVDRVYSRTDGMPLSSEDISPVFLSPSSTNFTRYYPYRLKNWHGSDRTFMAYFAISAKEARLELTE